MNRTKSALLLVAAMVTSMTPGVSRAQRVIPGRFAAGVFGGVSLPAGDFKDIVGKGWHGGALLKMDISRAFDLRVDGAYTPFGSKDVVFTDAVVTTHTKMTFATLSGVLNLGADSAAYPGDNSISPYLIGGAGYYRVRFDGTCSGVCTDFVDAVQTQTNFGLNAGAGATVPLAGFRTFVEARYHSVHVDANFRGNSVLLVSAGIKTK